MNLRCRYVDFGDSCWVTTFHEAAQFVLSMTSVQVKALEEGEGGREALELKIKKCYFEQPLKLTIKEKIDTYNCERRPNVTIVDAHPVAVKALAAAPFMTLMQDFSLTKVFD